MPPMVIAGGIAAAGAIGGAAIGASSSRRASQAAATTAQNTANANNALTRDIYNQNSALLSPFVTRGNQAGAAINELLGLGGPANAPQPGPMQPPMQPQGYGGGNSFGELMQENSRDIGFAGGYQPRMVSEGGPQMGGGFAGSMQPMAQPTMTAGPMQPQAGGGSATSAFDNFLNSAGARYQLDEGYRAVNTGYAARGALQSGAAMKALQDRGQQTMLNNYFMPYMGLLGNQQGVGMAGASAVAGVGQNYANSVSSNNNSAGTAAANAALMNGNSSAQMWSTAGNALGNIAGSFGSSYGNSRPQSHFGMNPASSTSAPW